jgi:rRNA maturation RNase YbeY
LQKNLYISSTLKRVNKVKIHKLVVLLKRELGFKVQSLFINFVSQQEIHRINKIYLKHDCTTDIITFNYSGSTSRLDGEIFISIDDAKYFANKYGVSLSKELTRLVVHGILHLTGYDDRIPADKKKMKLVENNLTIKYNFPLLS